MNHLRSTPLRSIRNIHRANTCSTSSTSTPTTSNPPLPPPKQSFLQRYRKVLLWTSLGLAIGGTLGSSISVTIAPPPYPSPGSHEDTLFLQNLNSRIDSEFKVKVLRGKCTAVAASLRGDEATWRELDTSKNNTLDGSGTLVGETLSGARSFGVERVFWNDKAHELVAVVWFGGGVSGWPGVTHGGAIATAVTEKIGLAARLAVGASSPSNDNEIQESSIGGREEILKSLDLTYKKPTYANAFYVVRAVPRYGASETQGLSKGEIEVDAQIETLDGKVCVNVTGIVPVSDEGQGQQGSLSGGMSKLKSLTPAKEWAGWRSRSDD